ncbi:MFS transporter [Schaalia sp. ZJ405]|uniref:MFS transporter n=1 Tax=Schaalia sp. ZJ405 TaxID=2709403 RepID=UPI0013EE19BF|nr:MFS transporter [Schaalia sp. ZJ405]QPK81944.1 MFS transporter [Schaalia sp. ZJ405]
MNFLQRNGFESKQQIAAFFSVVFSGQLIYSAFESFKMPFYERLVQYYGLTDTQFGLLFTALGVAVLFYVPAGWVNNRFNTRTVLIGGLIYRCITSLILILCVPPFPVMFAIALTWGVLDAIFWPAVVKGVVLFSGRQNKGMGLGLLTALRAGGEAMLNGVLIGVMAVLGGTMLVFRTGMIVYACLALPMAYLVHRFVPADPQNEGDVTSGSEEVGGKEAFRGLIATLKIPAVWLAGLTGMCVYWVYMTAIYITPYLTRVHSVEQNTASLYTTVSAFVVGLSGALVGGIIADKVFHSSAKTLALSLGLAATVLVVLALVSDSIGWVTAAIGMSLFAFSIAMGKAIQQAPVAELHLPTSLLGSAMSVNSFIGFACILWAMPINGAILDSMPENPTGAFRIIFLCMAAVGVVGAVCALLLVPVVKRMQTPPQESSVTETAAEQG